VVNLLPKKVETREEKSEQNQDVVFLTEIHHCTGYKPAITKGPPSSRGKCYPSTLRYTYNLVPELQNKYWPRKIEQQQPRKNKSQKNE
jgi:hypothetical protein